MIDELLQEVERVRKAAEKAKSDDLLVMEDLRNRAIELEREMEEQRSQTELVRFVTFYFKNEVFISNFFSLRKKQN